MRLLTVSAVFAALIVVPGACIESDVQRCSDGTLCGPGYRCATAEEHADGGTAEPKNCVLASCGDRVKDAPLEQCDDGDGNSQDPNACRPGCLLPSCGDGIVDDAAPYNEVCEPGDSTSDPDGTCSPDCLSRGRCGNGVVDTHLEQPEACDDGNRRSGDGCSSQCRSEVLLWARLKAEGLGARYGHAMASEDRRMVVFGGHDGERALGDTLENSGRGWVRVSPGPNSLSPTPRWGHGLVWDSGAERFVMAGGFGDDEEALQETWAFEQDTWRQVATSAFPAVQRPGSAVASFPLAYDAFRDVIVTVVPAVDSMDAETWEFDGETWRQLDVETPEHDAGPLAFFPESVNKVALVAFNGDNRVHFFDGESWQASAHAFPEATVGNQRRLAFHPQQGVLLLSPKVALVDSSNPLAFHPDSGWTPWLASGVPILRDGGWATNGPSGTVWTTGGRTSNTVGEQSWSLDGPAELTLLPDAATPDTTGAAAVGYDPVRDRLVAFGGTDGTARTQTTWEFDGDRWTRLSLDEPVPSARAGASLGWSGDEQQLILVGGAGLSFIGTASGFDGESWHDALGVGPSGTSISMIEAPITGQLFAHQARRASGKGPNVGMWVFDGAGWASLPQPPPKAPPASYGFDVAHGVLLRLVVAGGETEPGLSVYDATNADWVPLAGHDYPLATHGMPAVWYPPSQELLWLPRTEPFSSTTVLMGDSGRGFRTVDVLGEGPQALTRQVAYDVRRRRIVAYTAEGLFSVRYASPESAESCVTPGDEDGDELHDCADPDCSFDGVCAGQAETECGDGIDNDGDGLVDCADPNCGGLLCGNAHRCYALGCQAERPYVSETSSPRE